MATNAELAWRADCLKERLDSLMAAGRADDDSDRDYEAAKAKFKKGMKVRGNYEGARVGEVISVRPPMVLTSVGDFHWTKLVKV